jgi:hypothetical protein
LRGDCILFEQLSQVLINTTDEIATNLVLPLRSGSLCVQSDRSFIHHKIHDGKIKIYVPSDRRERRACYRSQLPELLQGILDVGSAATFNISSIIAASLGDLEDILIEQDVPSVEWIDKPILVVPDIVNDERPSTPISSNDRSSSETPLAPRSRALTSDATPTRQDRAVSAFNLEHRVEVAPPELYPELIEQVVRSAQYAGSRNRATRVHADMALPHVRSNRSFDHQATFGSRDGNAFVHDRRIGAVGEAYVRLQLMCTKLKLIYVPGFRDSQGPKFTQLYISKLA